MPVDAAVISPWNLPPVGAVRARGWLLEQLRTDLDAFVMDFPALSPEAAADVYVTGRIASSHWRAWWDGEAEGKWLDGLTRLAHVTGDPKAIARVDEYLGRVVAAADDDGYIGIYQQAVRLPDTATPGDPWTQSLILTSLLAHYEATGDAAILEAVRGAVAATMRRYDPVTGLDPFRGDPRQSQVHGHNLMIVEPVLWLHDITGEQAYVDFAIACYERFARGDIGWMEGDGIPERLADPDVPMVAHGPHTAAQLRVPVLLYRATGDEKWRRLFEAGFEKLQRYVSATGAVKSDECIGSPEFEGLPFPESGHEFCTITEQLHSLHLAYAVTGDARYADRAELLALNAAQGQRRHDGRGVAYVAADNQYDASEAAGIRYKYSPVHSDVAVCCSPSAMRVMAHHVSRSLVRTGDGGLAVAYYGPWTASATIGGTPVKVSCDTDYPFTLSVRVTVSATPAVRFPLRLRVPRWASDVRATPTDGIDVVRDGDHLVATGEWGGGAAVDLEFTAPVTTERAVDGTVALRHGPLVYSLDVPVVEDVMRRYDLPGYADVGYRPAGRPDWHLSVALDPSLVADEVVVVRDPGPLPADPFADPPVRLDVPFFDAVPHAKADEPVGRPVTRRALVPFGSTRLRRTTFPVVGPPRRAVPVPPRPAQA